MSWSCDECGGYIDDDHRLCRIVRDIAALNKMVETTTDTFSHASLHTSTDTLLEQLATVIMEHSLAIKELKKHE